MSTTIDEATLVRTRDLEDGQRAVLTLAEGGELLCTVVKNAPRAGRITVTDGDVARTLKYKEVEGAQVADENGAPVADAEVEESAGTPEGREDLERRMASADELSGSDQRAHVQAQLNAWREAADAPVRPEDAGMLREAQAVGIPLRVYETRLIAKDNEYAALADEFRKRGLSEARRKRMLALAIELGFKHEPGKGESELPLDGKSKPKRKSTGVKRADAYPPEVREAVGIAKEIRGTSHGAAGPKQHAAVRAELGGNPPLEVLAGMTERQLRSAAKSPSLGGMSRERFRELEGLKEFGKRFDDPFCRGRSLAAILAAIVEQGKRAAK